MKYGMSVVYAKLTLTAATRFCFEVNFMSVWGVYEYTDDI